MKEALKIIAALLVCLLIVSVRFSQGGGPLKGLLVYDTAYGSTIETAYWIKAIIGCDQQLDVKHLDQVITIQPYDYIIIGSHVRRGKPSDRIYAFVRENEEALANKKVCYYLTCSAYDETMVLKLPGQEAYLIGGRNYLLDIMKRYPDINPLVIGGFGGRQVGPTMDFQDKVWLWFVGKLAKDLAAGAGLDVWESLVPERVEAFANEVRIKILGLEPLKKINQYRGFWNSPQPASLADGTLKKHIPRPYTALKITDEAAYIRSRCDGNLDTGISLINSWSMRYGITLREQAKTTYNIYYHGKKDTADAEVMVHIVAAEFPEDPGNVHFSFQCYDPRDKRKNIEAALQAAASLCTDKSLSRKGT